MRRMSYDSGLATEGGDETAEMGRETLTVQCTSNRPDVCFVTECNEETGRNLQVVMGMG
jgi:hypothetical protein